MAESKALYLCGGVLFFLLAQTKPSKRTAREHTSSYKDDHSDPTVMEDLIYAVTGSKGYGASKDTSKFRECLIDGSVNVPFNDKSVCDGFNDEVKNKYLLVLGRMTEFVDWHIAANKSDWLVKAILEIIQGDDILDEELFYARPSGIPVSKAEMLKTRELWLPAFLIGIIHYIETKTVYVQTLEALGSKQPYNERIYSGNLGAKIIGGITVHRKYEKSDTGHADANSKQSSAESSAEQMIAIQSFSKEYYQLIVTCEEDVFNTGVVTVTADRALGKSYVPPEIFERCSTLSETGVEELKRFPAIICQENTEMKGVTSPTQFCMYCYIQKVMKAGKNVKIAFKPIAPIQQIKLCDKHNAVFFDLDMDCAITDLNHSAWSVHKVNLFEAFKEAGIPGMPTPM